MIVFPVDLIMYFDLRKKSYSMLLLILLVGISSCGWQPLRSLKIGEDNPKKENLKLSLGQYSCFSELKNKIDDYSRGLLSEKQIHLFMHCIQTSLDRFQFYSVGHSKNKFKPSELQSFLNREFLSKNKLTNEFMHELMQFKVILLGGDLDSITRLELNGIVEFVQFLEKEAVLNLPLVRMYEKYSKDGELVPELLEMELVKIQFITTAKKLAERMMRNHASYDLDSFANLVIEKRKFFNTETEPDKINPVLYVKTLKSLNAILTGENSDIIKAEMWPQLLDLSARSYMLFLSYKLYLEKAKWTFGDGLKYFATSMNDLFDLANKIIEVQPNGVLTFDKVDQFIEALSANQIIPAYLRTESIKTTYKHLVARVFSPNVISPASPFSGFSQHTLNEIRSEFILWSEVQKNINQIAEAQDTSSITDMLNFDFFKNNFTDKKPHPELEKILSHIRPLFTGSDPRVHVVFKDDFAKYDIRHNVHGLTRLNLYRALTRLLFRGFSKNEQEVNVAGITEDDTRQFIDVIRGLAEDLKILNVKDKTSGYRIFTEANLFTFSGNGIQPDAKTDTHLLNFTETSELLALIWTGARISSTMHEKLHYRYSLPVMGLPFNSVESPLNSYKDISRDFFIKNFRSIALPELSSLPYMMDFVQKLNNIEYIRFITALLDISSDESVDPEMISFSQTATIVTLLHYAEVLFVTFDKDKNGYLNEFEIMSAFPRFHHYLGNSIEKKNGEMPSVERIKSIFAFLAENKRLPKSLKDKARIFYFETWYFNEDSDQEFTSLPTMNLNRADIINVLQIISGSGAD